MSDLQRSFLKSKLSKLPPVPPFSEADEEQAELESGDAFGSSSSSSASASTSAAAIPRLTRRRQQVEDYSPRTAEGRFEQALEVDVPVSSGGTASFRVYYTPPRPGQNTRPSASNSPFKRPPASAAASSLHEVNVDINFPALPTLRPGVGLPTDDDYDGEEGEKTQATSSNPGTMFVFHHGAGFSALSYALVAAEITKMTNGEVGVLAYDCRGHGRTRLNGVETSPLDMSIETLSNDLTGLLSTMFPRTEEMPSLMLVGHSMGGSVVVSAAHALSKQGFNRISGVVVLDVVEGTAMDALGVMRGIILSHPSGFGSVEDAIRWHVDSKTIANLESARISVPPLIEPNPSFTSSTANLNSTSNASAAGEEEEEEEPQEVLDEPTASPAVQDTSRHAYRWKANLLATEPFWKSWFQGLSFRFLTVKTARLLLLAGTDRLDKELMIGQMQGKYQLEVIADVGHSLHEDAPERTAKILIEFWRRNERINLPSLRQHVKKVGEA